MTVPFQCLLKLSRLPAAFAVAAVLGATAAAASGPPPPPGSLVIHLGHAAGGLEDRLARALARSWGRWLEAPVRVEAGGPHSALAVAGALLLLPRDGSTVMAGDLGRLALDYRRERPDWIWARQFEHMGVYALDPAVVLVRRRGGPSDFRAVMAPARGRVTALGVRRWDSLGTIALLDVAARAGWRISLTPLGAGDSLATALGTARVGAAMGRLSDLRGGLRVIAAARQPGAVAPAATAIDHGLGFRVIPAGGVFAVTVHASLRNFHPARFERLSRSLAHAVDDPDYREAAAKLGVSLAGVGVLRHESLWNAVQAWWDAARRVAPDFDRAPNAVTAHGKITGIARYGREIRFLGLDGKSHRVLADPDFTKVTLDGSPVSKGDPLMVVAVGMFCDIARPGPLSLEATEMTCRSH